MRSVKEDLHEIADNLPEDVTWNDVIYEIYVRQKVELGRQDGRGGNVVSHEDVKKKYLK